MDMLALIISLLALAVSAWALIYSRRQAVSSERLTKVEERRHELELADRASREAASKVADVRVTLLPDAYGAPAHLVIYNGGPAVAGSLSVELDSEAGAPPMFVADTQRQSLPDIRPGGSEEVRLVTDYESGAIFYAILRWTDPRGPQESRTKLSLFQ